MRRMATNVLAAVIVLVFGAVTMASAGYRYSGFHWGPSEPSYRYPSSKHGTSASTPVKAQGYQALSKQGSKTGQSATGKLSKNDFANAKVRIDNLGQKLAGIKKTDLTNTQIGKFNGVKLSKSDFSNTKMKIDKLANKLTYSKKIDAMNTKLASADKLKSLNLQQSVGLPGFKPSDGMKAKMSTTTVPSGVIPDNPIQNATGFSSQISPDGTTRTDTWTLPDGSKLERTDHRANQNGPWVPDNQYTLTRPDGTKYVYAGNVAANPIGPWATMVTPDNPGPVPPGNGGNGPGNGPVAGIPAGNSGGFDPGTVIGPIVAGIAGGGIGGPGSVGYEAPPIVYADPAPAPQPQ
jgi:hypothetical protein